MDKIEKMIKEELMDTTNNEQLDIDSILDGVHAKIHRRSIRRKTLYSSPVVVLLVLVVIAIIPRDQADEVLPGGELLMAGWTDSWTGNQEIVFDEDQELFEQSVDYLIDEHYLSYIDEIEELMDANDLEAFIDYLEEV